MPDRASPLRSPRRLRRVLLHGYRWAVFALLLVLIRDQHTRHRAQQQGQPPTALTVEHVREFYPDAAQFSDWRPEQGGQSVMDRDGNALGYVVQTAPEADRVIGFSGPTNTLIAFDKEHRILGLEVLRSGDTPEHLRVVVADPKFLKSWNGLSWAEAQARRDVDGVSGATLTSLAIAEGIARRLGGTTHSYRFPEPITVDKVQPFFPAAARLAARREQPALQEVLDAAGRRLGSVARTAPAADNLIGFQGPTDTLIAFDPQDRVLGIAVHKTYETESYVDWVRDDRHFLESFNGKHRQELADLDLQATEVEGVSGATMTSMAMARGVVLAADQWRRSTAVPPPRFSATSRDIGTVLVVLGGLVIAFSNLRGQKPVRLGFQILVVAYLGLLHGDMVSQALLVGWAQSGVAWRLAPGLLFLVLTAFAVPLATRKQPYCHHLCPHGAAQQLLRHVGPRPGHLPQWWAAALHLAPGGLLLWTLLVAILHWPFHLTAIEPFDAYVFRVAGWATIAIAVVGLAAALKVPMAYCRFGCPTGALLNFLRFNSHSDRLTAQDCLAAVFLLLALGLRYHCWLPWST